MPLHKFGASALLQAMYTRLTTNALTSAYSTYNYTPSTATFPYVSIGGIIGGKSADFTSRDIKAEDLVIHVNIWSNHEGDSEAATMMDNVVQAVTGTDLAITGYTTLKGIPDFQQILTDATDPNDILRQGILRFRFQVA